MRLATACVAACRSGAFQRRSPVQVSLRARYKSATAELRTEYALAVAGNDGQLIGSARLTTGEYESGQIGFALRPDHWGQGKRPGDSPAPSAAQIPGTRLA